MQSCPILFIFCHWESSRSPDSSYAAPVMSFTFGRAQTPARPSWTSSSMWRAMETWCHRLARRPRAALPHRGLRSIRHDNALFIQHGNSDQQSGCVEIIELLSCRLSGILDLIKQWIFNFFLWTGGVAQQAPISGSIAPRDGAADAAGPDEWGYGGDGWTACTGPAAERWEQFITMHRGTSLVPYTRMVSFSDKHLLFVFWPCPGVHEVLHQDLDPPRSDLFLFPDESGNSTQESSPSYPVLHSPLITPVPNLAQEADDFCILDTPGSRGDVGSFTDHIYENVWKVSRTRQLTMQHLVYEW